MKTKDQNINIPADGWLGFKQHFSSDALSGLLVFLLALPLSLGIAKASDFPPIFGILTAIIGGVVVSFFSGSRLTIKGPAAGLIVIASGSVAAFGGGEQGWHLALGAVVAAGILQIMFGLLKLGRLADFFPQAAIHGMLAAIGIIIISKQVHTMLGIDPSHIKGKEPLELLAMIPESIMHENAHLAEIGFACLGLMALFSVIKHKGIKKIPAPLVVLLVSIPLGQILHIKTEGQIANFALVKVGDLASNFKHGFFNADFSGAVSHTGLFIEYVILFALIGSLESLLTAKAIDIMDPFQRKSDFNKDLAAVGLGNSLAGLLGGLPMISEVARSSANVANGAKTRWANFFHGLFLLLAVLFAVPLIEMIPNAALAAMLIFVGYRLAHPREFAHVWQVGKGQFIIYVSTILVTLATDLLIGVGVGILLEILINLALGAPLRDFFKPDIRVQKMSENGYLVQVDSSLMFTGILRFKKIMAELPKGKEVILNLNGATLIDHTAQLTLKQLVGDYTDLGGTIQVKGLDNHRTIGQTATSVKRLDLE